MAKVKVAPGDLVRIVAPAGKGAVQNLPGIQSYVESLGLVADITDNIYNSGEPFYSNSDEFRASDLASAILNDNCKVIWCIRGGSGANRLIRYLDKLLPSDYVPTPKIFVGYSDITVLHIYLNIRYGWSTVHGAMLEAIVNGSYDRSSPSVTFLEDIVFTRRESVCYPNLLRLDEGGQLVSPINAPVIGGNLTLVEASIGTSWEIDASNKILLLEDVSVAAYSMERSLEHLKQGGVFDNVRAIIFGDFTDPDSTSLIDFVEQRFAKDGVIKCPVFVVPGIGHGKVNLPLPLNSLGGGNITFDESEGSYRFCVDI